MQTHSPNLALAVFVLSSLALIALTFNAAAEIA